MKWIKRKSFSIYFLCPCIKKNYHHYLIISSMEVQDEAWTIWMEWIPTNRGWVLFSFKKYTYSISSFMFKSYILLSTYTYLYLDYLNFDQTYSIFVKGAGKKLIYCHCASENLYMQSQNFFNWLQLQDIFWQFA